MDIAFIIIPIIVSLILFLVGIFIKDKRRKNILFTVSVFPLFIVGIISSANFEIANDYLDKKAIVGSWTMDTSDFGEGIERLKNLDGVITKITLFSDGTCIVDGESFSENGKWTIVDGKLRVTGLESGGKFWYYDDFTSNYELNDDELLIYYYDDNGYYTYYRIS